MTDRSEEWGPWIEHDGRGYPSDVIGAFCQVFAICRNRGEFGPCEPFKCMGRYVCGGSWNWDNHPGTTKITRYRIRKPRGLTILEGLLEHLPEREGEDA